MLTAKKIRQAIKRPGRHADGHGLYLQVVSPTNTCWVLRYERAGREHMLGLGPLHVLGLKEARQRARAARLSLLDGIDPIEAKRARRAATALAAAKSMTFEAAARGYFAAHGPKWRNDKTRHQFIHSLEQYILPVFGTLPVAAIDVGLVLKVIEPLWTTKTVTASRVRGRIEAVLDWATVRGCRAGDNPARWKGHLDQVLPARNKVAKIKNFAALPYAQIGEFMTTLRATTGSAARALEFAILTTARSGEAVGARWTEIDLAQASWTIPAGRMKAGKEHRVPLAPRAVALLRTLPKEKDNPFVFIGAVARRGIAGTALLLLLRRLGYGVTVHGFRSAFMDWAHETTSFPKTVIDQVLAHAVTDGVEAAYRRGDLFNKRRRLMEAWAAYCDRVPAGDVVPLRSVP
jgi:integrase